MSADREQALALKTALDIVQRLGGHAMAVDQARAAPAIGRLLLFKSVQ